MTTIRLAPTAGAVRLVNDEGARLGLRGPATAVVLTPVGRPGVGVPAAGATGAVLAKASAADFDTYWLATTAYGRAALAWADAAAGRAALGVYSSTQVDAGFQPLDADLTAIAALSTTAYGRSLLTPADAAAGRSLLELGASNSPTFAGLTTTGPATFGEQLFFGAAASYANGSAYTNAANGLTIGLAAGSTNDLYMGTPTSGLSVLRVPTGTRNVEFGGAATFYGSAPGTAAAGEVRIGGGQINAAGSGTFGGQVLCAGLESSGVAQAFACKGSSGTYGTFFHSGTAIGDIGTANQVVAGGSSADLALTSRSGDLILGAGTNPRAKVPASSAADEIALYLYDQSAGSLKRVTRGAADSGGTGYRLLRIAN